MKRKAEVATEEPKEVKPRMMEEEVVEKGNLVTKTMSMSLLHLPPEMVAMVASYLDLTSYIALAKSCSSLLNTLTPHPELWKVLLQRTEMGKWDFRQQGLVMKVKQAAEFLAFMETPDEKLVQELFHKICSSNPAVPSIPSPQDLSSLPIEEFFNLLFYRKDLVSVSCPCDATHEVTSFGFVLLELVELALRKNGIFTEAQLKIVSFKSEVVDFLKEIAFRAKGQNQMIESFELFSYNGGLTPIELAALLQNTRKWFFERCLVEDQALVQGLAEEAERGSIGKLLIKDLTLAKVKAGHLKKVWKITSSWGWWGVMCSQCRDIIEVVYRYQGWSEMHKVIERVRRKNCAHYKKAPRMMRKNVTKSLRKYFHHRKL